MFCGCSSSQMNLLKISNLANWINYIEMFNLITSEFGFSFERFFRFPIAERQSRKNGWMKSRLLPLIEREMRSTVTLIYSCSGLRTFHFTFHWFVSSFWSVWLNGILGTGSIVSGSSIYSRWPEPFWGDRKNFKGGSRQWKLSHSFPHRDRQRLSINFPFNVRNVLLSNVSAIKRGHGGGTSKGEIVGQFFPAVKCFWRNDNNKLMSFKVSNIGLLCVAASVVRQRQ